MTYKEALEWIEANKHLVGTKTEKGLFIGELVAVPINPGDRESFLRSYVLNRNSDISLFPFVGDDMEVWAIDTNRLTPNGVLLFKKLAD